MKETGLVDLALGGAGSPLYVFVGAGGEAKELAPLARHLESARPVVAVLPFDGVDPQSPHLVEDMADRATELIRTHDPTGPYLLAGYSFGGVLALETAQRLRAAGGETPMTVIVDPIFHHRHWPRHLFLAAAVRRSVERLREAAGHSPGEVVRTATHYGGRAIGALTAKVRLGARTATERDDTEDSDDADGADEDPLQTLNFAAMKQWAPHPFAGDVLLLASQGGDFRSDPAALWGPYLPGLQVGRLAGRHLDLVRRPSSIAELAARIENGLEQGTDQRPRVLIASTFTWATPGRLAVACRDAGFLVDAVAPRSSVLHRIAAVAASYPLGLTRPLHDLRAAITQSAPALVIPTDDPTRAALHLVHDAFGTQSSDDLAVRALLERSLGPVETFSHVYSRGALMELAATLGCRAPATGRVTDLDALHAWLSAHPGPAVLKTDGSWGGRGVEIVATPAEAEAAWHRLHRPIAWPRLAKRLLVDHEPWSLRARLEGRRGEITVQSFVRGRPANAAVTCLDGEVVAVVTAEVIQHLRQTGPSTVLRVVHSAEMVETVTRLVEKLRLSGLCGFDFMIEEVTGHAYVIELNPRATPTSHLLTDAGVEPLAALAAALRHEAPPTRREPYADGLVALFPQEVRRDPTSVYLTDAYHDRPDHAADFVLAASARGARGGRPWLPGMESNHRRWS